MTIIPLLLWVLLFCNVLLFPFITSKAPELCEASLCGQNETSSDILTTKADIYSLGCIIIELFRGEITFAFKFDSADDVFDIVL